jgi:spore coat polysaccharide biosynthesis protein SpsF
MKSNLLITVRFSSSRLPGKCLLKLGHHSVLGHCIARARAQGFRVIVCTGDNEADKKIVEECMKSNCEVFVGNSLNKIARWAECFEHYKIETGHILDCDDPYFDTDEISRSLAELNSENFDLVRPSHRSDSGFASVGLSITSEFLTQLSARTIELTSQDLDVIPWGTLLLPNDRWKFLEDNYIFKDYMQELRLTLDYIEDLDLLRKIAEKFEFDCKRAEVEKFLFENSEIRSINLHRIRDFKENKMLHLQNQFNL